MKIDLNEVKKKLWENKETREKIRSDYKIEGNPDNADDFAKALLDSLTLDTAENGFNDEKDNNAVFKAAVYAVGSNNRKWSTFRKKEVSLRKYLCDYSLEDFNKKLKETNGCIHIINSLVDFFPGRTATNDAVAVLRWADLLVEKTDEYHKALKETIENLKKAGIREEPEHLPCLAAIIGNNTLQPKLAPGRLKNKWIAPGMGSVLASEFLRNLGLHGYKPDTHIRRLFDFSPASKNLVEKKKKGRALEIAKILGSRNKEIVENIAYSLVGIDLTPNGVYNHSQVDTLVWAFGSYVEKKGGLPLTE